MTTKPLPFLPGYTFNLQPKSSFHKQQRFAVDNGTRMVDVEYGAEKVSNMQASSVCFDKYGASAESVNPKELSSNTTFSGKTPPAWIVNDKQVLQFAGYIEEAVHFSAVESSRVRKMVLSYHLENATMSISEIRSDNSGLQGGQILKRHKFPKEGGAAGELLKPSDLQVGGEVKLYGYTYKLTSCSDFTRVWYKNKLEIQQPEAKPLPVDQFTQALESRATKAAGIKSQDFVSNVADAQKFFANDGKVLRFYCVWDDKETNERRLYIMKYYLADDTVELTETAQPNSGRDQLSTLLKRSKLPKDYLNSVASVATIGRVLDKVNGYYTMDDFKVGAALCVFGRELLVVDTDAFTKKWYIENRGKTEQDFVALSVPKIVKQLPKREIPPYNGYGTEDDSLNSCFSLVPKPPKKDVTKLLALDGKSLRFLAKFQHPSVDDVNRRFLVTFYMADDTVAIFEKEEKDTGFPAGKFLERSKTKNPKTGKYFLPNDFHVGGLVIINSFGFELLHADEFTLKFMEEHKEMFHVANLDKVYADLKEDGLDSDKLEDLVTAFKTADLNGNGTIDKEEFRQCLAKHGLRVNEHQLITLIRKYDSNHDGSIDFEEFATAFRSKFAF